MEGKYLLAYTIYNPFFKSGFKSYYRHFDNLETMRSFIKIKNIEDSCIVYEKNMDLVKE